jgi:hypothetical protein
LTRVGGSDRGEFDRITRLRRVSIPVQSPFSCGDRYDARHHDRGPEEFGDAESFVEHHEAEHHGDDGIDVGIRRRADDRSGSSGS